MKLINLSILAKSFTNFFAKNGKKKVIDFKCDKLYLAFTHPSFREKNQRRLGTTYEIDIVLNNKMLSTNMKIDYRGSENDFEYYFDFNEKFNIYDLNEKKLMYMGIELNSDSDSCESKMKEFKFESLPIGADMKGIITQAIIKKSVDAGMHEGIKTSASKEHYEKTFNELINKINSSPMLTYTEQIMLDGSLALGQKTQKTITNKI